MVQKKVDELTKMGMGIIGPRIKDSCCVFCGADLSITKYCDCKKSMRVNQQVKKLRRLIDKYSYVTDLKEYTRLQLSEANFPKKFAGMDFSDYVTETNEQKNNLLIMKNYVDKAMEHYLKATNLIFVGNFGNGKTMLMSIGGDEIIRKYGIQVKYVNIFDFAESIKKSFESKELSTSKIIEGYKKAPILILDDIDKINPSPFIIDLMYGIANYRGENKLPTWINANHSLEELSNNFYGEGTISRFYDSSIKAKFTGENWRLRT